MSHATNICLKRVENISTVRFYEEYIEQQIPVVITGDVCNWPAIERWTDSYLIDTAGDLSLKVKPKADYIAGESMREREAERDYFLRTVLSLIATNNSQDLSYARESDLLSRCPLLKSDIIQPSYLGLTIPHAPSRTGSVEPKIWLGPANTVAQLHWDPEHNLFAQVRGRKRVILVPPEDASLTYPIVFSVKNLFNKPFFVKHSTLLSFLAQCASETSLLNSTVHIAAFQKLLAERISPVELSLLCDFLLDVNNCHVDAGNPDFTQHPLFSKARRYEAILEPGDLLFIPYYWHHYIQSLEPSISVNWFFLQEQLAMTLTNKLSEDILLAHLAP